MGVQPNVDVDTEVEVKADAGLGKLYEIFSASEKKTSSFMVKLVEYVTEHQLTNEVINKTLEDRGLSEGTRKAEISRIRSYIKKPDVFKQLQAGEITVKQARQLMVKGPGQTRTASKKTIAKRVNNALNKAVEQVNEAALLALKHGWNLERFSKCFDEAEITAEAAWKQAELDVQKASKNSKKQPEGKTQGELNFDPDEVVEPVSR